MASVSGDRRPWPSNGHYLNQLASGHECTSTKATGPGIAPSVAGECTHPVPDRRFPRRILEALDPEVRRARLVRRYYTRQGHLHGDCFYAGLCDPERRIRETTTYIDDTEQLAAP